MSNKPSSTLLNQSAQQGAALVVAANFAYVLDYFFNFAAGRLLQPDAFSIIVSLAGISNILVVGSRVIQTVVTRYISRFDAEDPTSKQMPAFFQTVWRSAWLWGTAVAILLFGLSWPISRWLQIEDIRVVFALAATAVLLVVRPVIGGGLQGVQQFAHLGVVQIVQAVIRLLLGVGLIWLGWGALGAMIALPIGSIIALAYGVSMIDKRVWQKSTVAHGITVPELFKYSAYTAVGLLSYAILVNMDAILVRQFFDTDQAGNYGAAVTLGKIVQFMPVAIVMLLFPKAAQRQASNQDPAKVLIPALTAVFLLCSGIVLSYSLFTDLIIRLTVGSQYHVDRLVLGLLATGLTFLALSNVWLFYFLSIEQTTYVKYIGLSIFLQGGLMFIFHEQLWHLPAAIALNGLILFLIGLFLFWSGRQNKEAS